MLKYIRNPTKPMGKGSNTRSVRDYRLPALFAMKPRRIEPKTCEKWREGEEKGQHRLNRASNTVDLEQEEGRMHHLLAPVGSGRAGRGRRGSERAQSGEAEGECEGEHRERGGDGEDYKVEEWRERGGGNPSFPRAPPCPTCIWRANFFGRWTLALVPREPSRQETESIFFSQQPGSGERVARPGPCPKPHTSIQTMENYILGVRPRQIQETKRALYVFRWRPILNLDLLIGLTHLKDIYGLSRLLYLLM